MFVLSYFLYLHGLPPFFSISRYMPVHECTSGKGVYILPRIPLTEGVGWLGT